MIEENDSNSTNIDGPIIENLRVIGITVHSLTISWSAAGKNTSSFLIEWFENHKLIGNANESFTDLIYTINNLYPCTQYKLTVTPNGSSGWAEIYGTTFKSKPSVPLNLTVNPLESERNIMVLNISWGIPKIGSICVKLYSIRISAYVHFAEHKREINTTLTNIMIENVHACTSYLVNVKAIDLDDNEGDYFEVQSKPTLKRVTRQPESSHSIFIKPIRATSTTATLYWEAVDPTNNCSIASVNTQCEYLYTEGYGFEVKDFSEGKYVDPTGIYTSRIISVTVENLSPYSNYICRAWVENTAGRSKFSNRIPVTTCEKAPSPPQIFKYVDHPNAMFTWDQPRRMPGVLLNYRIQLFWKPQYPVPDTCKVKRRLTINNINPSSFNLTWTSSEGFSNYEANIAAQTFGGWSEDSSRFLFRNNKNGVPDEVTNLTDNTRILRDDPNALETILSWNLPCSSRGLLKYFEISISGWKEDFDDHKNSTLIYVKPGFGKNQVFSTNLGELRAEYHYVFRVCAMTNTSDNKGAVAKHGVFYPAGMPPQPDSYYIESITLDPDKIQRTSTSFRILLPLFANTNGRIRYYAIIVSRRGYNFTQAHKRYYIEENDWPDIASWRKSMENDFRLPYQASEPKWEIYCNCLIHAIYFLL